MPTAPAQVQYTPFQWPRQPGHASRLRGRRPPARVSKGPWCGRHWPVPRRTGRGRGAVRRIRFVRSTATARPLGSRITRRTRSAGFRPSTRFGRCVRAFSTSGRAIGGHRAGVIPLPLSRPRRRGQAKGESLRGRRPRRGSFKGAAVAPSSLSLADAGRGEKGRGVLGYSARCSQGRVSSGSVGAGRGAGVGAGAAPTGAVALSKAARAARWSGVSAASAASAASNGSVGTDTVRAFRSGCCKLLSGSWLRSPVGRVRNDR
jgi:hypothetical protein